MNLFQTYQSVKVKDTEYERFGQVGSYLGPGEEPGESLVKFDDGNDTFPNDALVGL